MLCDNVVLRTQQMLCMLPALVVAHMVEAVQCGQFSSTSDYMLIAMHLFPFEFACMVDATHCRFFSKLHTCSMLPTVPSLYLYAERL